jgi:putative PIN family toxin of toxin-antitoxin system
VKVFLDTNVVVSAVATRGLCADLLQVILAEHELVLGETVLAEVPRVLHRKLRVPPDTVAELEAYLRKQAVVATAPEARAIKGRDTADAAVVGEAVGSGAEALVTGDRDLLDLPRPPLRIVSPRGLWELLRRAT